MSTSLVNNKYRITRRIGGGSFGEIYLGVGPSGEKVAVKFEKHGSRCPQLRHEYKVYREVAGCHGFCRVYHFGTQDNYNVMVMDLLGPSLEDLFNKCNRKFSLKTVLQLADQMLERVDTFHSRHLIHRDIKPANFVIGTGENANVVFCVDFGLSKRYRHPKTLQHIPHRDGRSLTGTPRYASINNHLGIEQSRRDDLESIAYVLIYFLKGTLPWQGLKAKNAQKKYRLILEKKQQVSIAQLCSGCPSQFGEFLAYTRALKFDTKPDIPFLRKMFRDLYEAQGYNYTMGKIWDWDTVELEHASETLSNAIPDIEINNSNNNNNNNNNSNSNNNANNINISNNNNNNENKIQQSTRPTSAKYPSQDPNSQKWGIPGKGVVGIAGTNGDIIQNHNEIDQSRDKQTSRSAGSFKRDEVVHDEGELKRRPHTANYSGRTAPEDDNGHVVAGARGMMQYRQARDPTDSVPVISNTTNHSRSSNLLRVNQQPQVVPVTRSSTRAASYRPTTEGNTSSAQYQVSRQNEPSGGGRPKSAGVGIPVNS